MDRLRRTGSDFEQRFFDSDGCARVVCLQGDRGSVRVVLMHDYHGSAVAVLHRLAGGFFGFKGSRRRRFRWAASRVSAWSQRGRLGVSPVEVKVM